MFGVEFLLKEAEEKDDDVEMFGLRVPLLELGPALGLSLSAWFGAGAGPGDDDDDDDDGGGGAAAAVAVALD